MKLEAEEIAPATSETEVSKMFLRMLKRDLKRKKTMNTILFLFIIIASMFMASGMNNIIAVTNGLDNYLTEAGVGDYNILTMGEHAVGALDDMLK